MTAFDQWIDEYKKPVEAGLRTLASLNKYLPSSFEDR